jgi:hypothetical protein
VLASFLIGIAGSAIVALLYGLFFAQREDKIRAYLSAKRKGWSRRRYVMAFVGAVRGEAVATDTRLLAYTWLFTMLCLATFFIVMPEITAEKLAGLDAQIEATQARLAGGVQTKEAPEAQLRVVRAKQLAVKFKFALIKQVSRFAGGFMAILLWAAMLFWLPFVVMRKRFAFELERFALRIQGLATKVELAELALAESEVVGEESLRVFVRSAGAIAKRHGIPQLVKTFDLWGIQSEEQGLTSG